MSRQLAVRHSHVQRSLAPDLKCPKMSRFVTPEKDVVRPGPAGRTRAVPPGSRHLRLPTWRPRQRPLYYRPMTPAVRCTDLVKRYPGRPPVEAVRGLDLAVEVGEC